MRSMVDRERLMRFLEKLGKRAQSHGTVYLTGGASAVLHGWRDATIDIDLKLDPEPKGVFEAIRDLKIEEQINVELASPDHFIPPIPDWQIRSPLIFSRGKIEFRHYAFAAQALSKIERGHSKDLLDVREMLNRNLTTMKEIRECFAAIKPQIIRFPSLDENQLREKIEQVSQRLSADSVEMNQ